MDEKSTRGLRRQLPRHDLAEIHDELERLHDDVAHEEGAERLAGRVARHPVDHAETDQRRADVARENERLVRGRQAESGEHRAGKHEQQKTEDDRGDAADRERETRADVRQAAYARQTTRMGYDPFAEGPHGVAMRSGELRDPRRDARRLDYEVWYPAEPGALAGPCPLLLYSHASGGHRRQSSFLCSHLASHGYVVAAADHAGNTAADFAERTRRRARGRAPTDPEMQAYIARIIADRVPDLRTLCDEVIGRGASEISAMVDPGRIGLVGWSFGGWAVLAAVEADDRFGAVAALAPAGSSNPLPGIIPAKLTYERKREAPTLILAADQDRFIPLSGLREIFDRTPSAKRMYVLHGADHQHFADDVQPEGGCTRERAHLFTRALTLAHFDEALKGDSAASDFLANAIDRLRARGVEANAV